MMSAAQLRSHRPEKTLTHLHEAPLGLQFIHVVCENVIFEESMKIYVK